MLQVIDLLMRHGASLTLGVAHTWHSPYSLSRVVHGPTAEISRLLREKHAGDDEREALLQAVLAEVATEQRAVNGTAYTLRDGIGVAEYTLAFPHLSRSDHNSASETPHLTQIAL